MKAEKNTSRSHFFVAMVLLLLPAVSARAQARREEALNQTESKQASKDDLADMKSRLEQLQTLMEAQQRALAEMPKRLDEVEDKARAASLASPKTDGITPELRTASLEVSQTPKTAPATQDKPKAADKPALVAGWDKNHACAARMATSRLN